MNHWSSGWVDWNLALDMIGGPNWVSNFADAAIIVNAEKQEYYKQPMYYALAHFSKFLKPGSTRLGFKVTNPDDNVRSTVFKTEENQLVVITVNNNDYAANLTIEGFAENVVGLTLGPRSFRTLVINNS
ncbi:putative glucosylceramidase 4 [Tetranychus urticae]|uniref:putative glucosylceramidase 4 n=1 Tax=Tetranychus urticae TaxID=32264 RepID=UPI00077BC997|nr:putative glucosylceramidase 4 [Tetranychus urticae]